METTHQELQLHKKGAVARILSISPRTLDALVAKRLVPYLAISPRLHLFDIAEVRAALADKFGVKAGEDR